jgi:hypothetical protein
VPGRWFVTRTRSGRLYRPIEEAQSQYWDAQVADPGEHTVQVRLVNERPGETGGAVVETDESEIVKGGGPVVVEVAGDPDLVHGDAGGGGAGPASANRVGAGGHAEARSAASWMVVRRGRRGL